MSTDKWIWLDKDLYPDNQKNPYTGSWMGECEDGTVVEFSHRLDLGKKIERVDIRYSADALVQLWINDRFIGTGPVLIGGDFLANDRPRKNRYATTLSCVGSGEDNYLDKQLVVGDLDKGSIRILARVRLSAVQICEFSMGQAGFMLNGTVYFCDGTSTDITTDESWDAVVCPAYARPGFYDARLPRSEVTKPALVEDIWRAKDSPLPLRVETEKLPIGKHIFTVAPGESLECVLEYDRIYAAYIHVRAKVEGKVSVVLDCLETEQDGVVKHEELIFIGDDEYIGTRMYSVGIMKASIVNDSDAPAILDVGINEAYLPSRLDCMTHTSDEGLNRILEVSKHTLKYCRQYIHLDSPKHCEPMACTGDYYVETMMSSFSFGDMTLADFDVVRTVEILKHNNGVMFHATYSLIWVRMLLDVYMRNGRIGLLRECEEGLSLLLNAFRGYIGENGLIETPPSYMFVDWIYIDGISLHHPPKALGQGVINMFYYDALCAASRIYAYLGCDGLAEKYSQEAESLRNCINELLYDKERGMYFEGLNTPTKDELIYNYMPQNVEKRYYRINTNALAVAFGVIDGEASRELMCRVLNDPAFDDYQPYFAHFVLQAIHRAGLDEAYALRIIDKWRAPTEECDKGLAEGFIPPEPTYSFDHSHAWGGTPLYSLPMALTSLEILEPGMTHISLCPRSLGLEQARVEIPTPMGVVVCDIRKDKDVGITAPTGVRVDIRNNS